MTQLETAPLAPERLDDVLRLFEKVYGEAPSAEEFAWWFDRNPVGPRTVFVAQEGDRIAGVLGASFYRAVVRGEHAFVALPLWAVTDPDFQGRGIFQRLNADVERAAREAGARLELGFTNRLAGPIYIGKLGWLDVHRLRIWARPLLPRRARSDGDGPLRRFGPEQEAIYDTVASRLRSHFVRNAAYLNWRYVDTPRGYTLIFSRGGYAVVGRKRFGGVDAAFVAELVASTVGETRLLLGRCVRAARGARALLALLPAVHAPAYLTAGFVPTPQTIRLIGHGLDADVPLGRRAWHFTLGDTDYF